MSIINLLALLLVVIGGLNWGLVGLLNVDVVAWLFGDMSLVARIIYVLVGLSAIYVIATHSKKIGK